MKNDEQPEQLSNKAKNRDAFVNIVWKTYLTLLVVFTITILLNLLIKCDWFVDLTKVICICYCVIWCFCIITTLFTGRIIKWYLTMLSAFIMNLLLISYNPMEDWYWIKEAEAIFYLTCVALGGFFGICRLIAIIIPKWIGGIILLIRILINITKNIIINMK